MSRILIKEDITRIKKKFLRKATLKKVASVNDDILATKLEALSENVNRIEKSMLTKWDVAKIVFQIITILCIIITLVFVIFEFIKS